VTLDFISVGGNRHPAAADWDREKSGLLAFGADNNIALWDPLVGYYFSIHHC
jgi:elongator complex protein 2